MFNRKQQGRGLRDGIAADDDLAGARLLCALGVGGERKYCASVMNHGGRHG
jgi:hypothetical protein